MRVLVTGALGYVGSRLTQYLSDRGIDCDACDPGFFDDCCLTTAHTPNIVSRDVRLLSAADVADYDAIVHLAGISNDPFGTLTAAQVYDPTREYSRRLGELCAAAGTRLIFASSCSVYGRQGQDLCDETTLPNPQTPYSRNKWEIEQLLTPLARDKFPLVMLRFATAFGMSPRMRFDIVINMLAGMASACRKIVLNSDGQAWRPHIDLVDMCRAIELSLIYDSPKPTVLNVGGRDCNRRIIDVARDVQRLVPGCELEFLHKKAVGDPADSLVHDRKIQDGVDSRTYRVAFDRIHQVFPDFECRKLDQQVENLVADLREVELSPGEFEDARYYRLQRYEWLWEAGKLDTDLVTRVDAAATR